MIRDARARGRMGTAHTLPSKSGGKGDKLPFLCCLLILFCHMFSYIGSSIRLDFLSSGIQGLLQNSTIVESACL